MNNIRDFYFHSLRNYVTVRTYTTPIYIVHTHHVAGVKFFKLEKMVSFSMEAMVRGYQMNESIWIAVIGEELQFQRKLGNSHDSFSVAVMKNDVIVGHMPRKISSVCSIFLLHGGSIYCRVIGSRCYSAHLPQGGLEIPCVLTFTGNVKFQYVTKVERLLKAAFASAADDESQPLLKKPRIESKPNEDDELWVKSDVVELKYIEKNIIIEEKKLNDHHMNYAQSLLKNQFPSLKGLISTQLVLRQYSQEGSNMIR